MTIFSDNPHDRRMERLIQLLGGTEGNRVYSDEGVGITLTCAAGNTPRHRSQRSGVYRQFQ